ncbi:unnamed protein product [Parascedosporium putredinis]|uniref:Ubiquitin-like protease family profile domain-containing protein n=1 Tax=Parascedosporium putredinis TaxID=1442378 RepID=A0A9P1MBI6_9PEZI|nr:unnamed protein product [Parascedosporium putredinis]CAI7998731.1 unnamed protein product [Parascedosporium putredinis]
MKFVQKEPDWMESASCKLFEAARRGALLEAQNQHQKEPEESKATSRTSDEKALPPEEPGNKQLTKSKSLPTDKAPSSSKLYTLPFKPLSDLGVRRSTRATPGFQRLRSREPSPPQWSKANRAWERSWDHSLVYPRTGRDRATVDRDDIQRLDEGEFLNDNLILCYLRYLQLRTEADNPAISSRIYFMNTYFFETLKQGKGSSINYDGVKKWTSKVDLFSYDYIIVPVNENAHWYLLIVCNPYKLLPAALHPEVPETSSLETDNAHDRLPDTPSEVPFFVLKDGEKESTQGEPPASDSQEMNSKDAGESTSFKGRRKSHKGHAPPIRKYDPQDARIISLDSLGTAHSPACRMLREYLLEEIKFRKNMEPPQPGPIGMTAKNIPQQSNFCDCGVFLLGYVEHFLANPDTFIATLLQKEKPTWSVDPSKLRVQIRETIFDLHRQQKVELSLENEKKRQDKKRRNASLSSKASLDECSIERNPLPPRVRHP